MASKKNQGRFLKKSVTSKTAQPQKTTDHKYQNTPVSKVVILFTILTLCVSLVASGVFLSKLGISFQLSGKTIADGVYIAGVNVGGMTKSQAVDAVLAEVGESYTTTPMVVTVQDQQLVIMPSDSGANLDVDAAVKEAISYDANAATTKHVDITPYLGLDTEKIHGKIEEFAVNFPTEGIESGYEITKETVEGEEQAVLKVTVGTLYYDFKAEDVYNSILNAYNNHRFAATYTCKQITAADIDLDAIYAQTCKEAVDATWDKETHEVIASENGYRFDLDSAKEALAAAQPGDVLQFPFYEVLPEVETESIDNALFRDELGTYIAKSGSSHNRDTNLRIACESLNGIILYPGDTFSYNQALGERTPEKGYLPADSYMGSKTIKTYGGGICQPSSSLYYCALIADLEIVQRDNHGFISAYMPYGMDATVDWDGPDFKFRNNTNYPIRIDAKASGGSVTITLMGTDEKDYYVEMEYEILTVSYPKTVEKEVAPNSGHRDGEVESTPYTGYTVQTYKCKYDKATDELISREEEAYSVYDKRDKVVYKVVSDEPEETEPTEPPATEPPATDPPATEPPTTEPPATEPPATDPPATDPPATDPPATDPPATDPPATDPPATDPPAMDPPQDPIGEAGSNAETPTE